jgi:LemA protein
MQGVIIAIGAAILFVVIFLIKVYNGLVQLRQRVQNSWSQVDVQLKRRYDLIPNLVNAVKGYAKHESETFESVTKARNLAVAAGNVKEQSQAETMLGSAIKSLFAVAEAYPDLKANSNFLQLQEELSEAERRISFARQFYNDTVQKFNTKIELFPNNLVAGLLGFQMVDYFNLQGEPEARSAVKVSF